MPVPPTSLVHASVLWPPSGLCTCSYSELLPLVLWLTPGRLQARWLQKPCLIYHFQPGPQAPTKCLKNECVYYSKLRGSSFEKQYFESQRTPLGS